LEYPPVEIRSPAETGEPPGEFAIVFARKSHGRLPTQAIMLDSAISDREHGRHRRGVCGSP
jgi:hypothetical protein